MTGSDADRTIAVEFGASIDDATVERVLKAVAAALAEPPPKGARINVRRA